MRGLSDIELFLLGHYANREASLPTVGRTELNDNEKSACVRLEERGLLRRAWSPDRADRIIGVPTPLGLIMLRLERLIRSRSAA